MTKSRSSSGSTGANRSSSATFPLHCSADDERAFLLESRDVADGWIGHWPDESPAELAELKKTGKATIHNAIWLSWVELFQEIGSRMTEERSR